MTTRRIVTELHKSPAPVAGEQVIDTSPQTGDTVKTTYDYIDGWLSKPGRFF